MFDLATNKALAAAGRREPRDVLNLLYIHESHLPLGQLFGRRSPKIPAIRQKAGIEEIRRNAR